MMVVTGDALSFVVGSCVSFAPIAIQEREKSQAEGEEICGCDYRHSEREKLLHIAARSEETVFHRQSVGKVRADAVGALERAAADVATPSTTSPKSSERCGGYVSGPSGKQQNGIPALLRDRTAFAPTL